MEYLLYHKRSYITGRALATQLGLKSTGSAEKLMRLGKIPVVRYGNSAGNFGHKDTNINNSELIKLCANSYYFSRWAEEHGYNTPFYNKFSMTNIPEFPFLLRRLHHMRGKDIILIKEMADLQRLTAQQLENRYWVNFTETSFELRVHVINGQIARVFKKLNPDEKTSGEFIRSSVKGYHYSLRTNLDKKYKKAQEMCLSIMGDLGLVFGGIDIAWDSQKREYVIWEVNTAPGLSQPTLDIYGTFLRKLIYGN